MVALSNLRLRGRTEDVEGVRRVGGADEKLRAERGLEGHGCKSELEVVGEPVFYVWLLWAQSAQRLLICVANDARRRVRGPVIDEQSMGGFVQDRGAVLSSELYHEKWCAAQYL